jgi:hypothetical protein
MCRSCLLWFLFMCQPSTFFTTSPHFLWIVSLQGCTPTFHVYWKDNLYKSHDRFENILSESLPFFIFYLVFYCRKGENEFKKSYWWLCYNALIKYIIVLSPETASTPQKIITHLFLYYGRSFVMSVAETGGCQGKQAFISYHISQYITSV